MHMAFQVYMQHLVSPSTNPDKPVKIMTDSFLIFHIFTITRKADLYVNVYWIFPLWETDKSGRSHLRVLVAAQ